MIIGGQRKHDVNIPDTVSNIIANNSFLGFSVKTLSSRYLFICSSQSSNSFFNPLFFEQIVTLATILLFKFVDY
jgi:hypothetical protein